MGIVVQEWNVNIIHLSYVKMIQPTKLLIKGGGKGRGDERIYMC